MCPQSTDKDEREEVARLLARMFASPDSSLAEENRPLWRCWLGRYMYFITQISAFFSFSLMHLFIHQSVLCVLFPYVLCCTEIEAALFTCTLVAALRL